MVEMIDFKTDATASGEEETMVQLLVDPDVDSDLMTMKCLHLYLSAFRYEYVGGIFLHGQHYLL
jgi:hypothetical protein